MSDLIEGLLAESELGDDIVLRELLGELEREATAVRPIPSAALSELMNPRPAGARRAGRRTARRPSFAGRGTIITGVVVIGVLGLGAGAAAASPEVRSAIGAGAAVIAHLFDPESEANPPATGSNHSPAIGGSREHPRGATPAHSHDGSGADHASSHQRDGSQKAGDPNSGSGSGPGSSGSNSSGSGPSGHANDSNSGDTHGGDSGRDSGKDGGGGNQSGHGGGSGKGH